MFVRARHEVGGQTVLTQKKTDPRLGSVVWSVGDHKLIHNITNY